MVGGGGVFEAGACPCCAPPNMQAFAPNLGACKPLRRSICCECGLDCCLSAPDTQQRRPWRPAFCLLLGLFLAPTSASR